MGVKQKWKDFGKNTGKAFTNFGKSVAETAKIAFTDEENNVEENGHRKLSNAWKETGKSFGEAGKSLGKAAAGTGKKIVGKDDGEQKPVEAKENEQPEIKKDEAIDV